MSFESRTIHSEYDKWELNVLTTGNEFRMLFLNNDSISLLYDGESWLKYTFFPALSTFIFNKKGMTEKAEEALSEIPSKEDKKELYEMFVRAEAMGWFNHIERD